MRVKPRYEEIAEDLLSRMDSGEFPVGSYLPTKKQLMDPEAYDVSLATLDNAFKVLQRLGRISPQQGVGTLVTLPPDELPGGEDPAVRFEALLTQVRTRVGALTGTVAGLEKRLADLADVEKRLADLEAKVGRGSAEDS
jgi:DNA-binding FadR family transcriptional regulator